MSRSPWENDKFALESLESIDRRFLPGTKQEVEFIKKELGLSTGAAVIDLGCGAGRHSIELAEYGCNVTGFDISSKMLAEAQKRAEERQVSVEFVQLDLLSVGTHFKNRTNIFDGAISICESGLGSLGWKNDLKVLRTVHSLLKPEAKLILTTFNGLRKYRGERISSESFDFLNGIVHWKLPDDWHGGEKLSEDERVYIPSEMKMLCEIAGFSSTEILGCKPGAFNRNQLQPDDIELMVICTK